MEAISCPKFAYIAGVYMGDGCFYGTLERATLTFVMADRDILEAVAKFHHEISGHSCSVRPNPRRPHLSRLRLTDSKLARLLKNLTGGKTRLPTLDGLDAMRNFIAGLMDTDGFISHRIQGKYHVNRFSLGFVNSGVWLADFLQLLRSIGVKVGKPTLKRKCRSMSEADCWQVALNPRSFIDAGLFFRCNRKQRVMQTYLNTVKRQDY
jgi:hypothetical protein